MCFSVPLRMRGKGFAKRRPEARSVRGPIFKKVKFKWINSKTSMSTHVTKVCGAAFVCLHNIKRRIIFCPRNVNVWSHLYTRLLQAA